ncbi:hypothetical protein Pan181_40570 [Aeoliella mucimassa]|uniref:Uncharacterized protein n=1 Tax=Aeoliella mucimassa TaxID=2527972 RepID=A0A518ASY5_9BACT|nr:hypothetical protein Pan181_40570 [Aeoliella mucimassa]
MRDPPGTRPARTGSAYEATTTTHLRMFIRTGTVANCEKKMEKKGEAKSSKLQTKNA